MSAKQWKRLDVSNRLMRGELSVVDGAAVLGLSERWTRHLRDAVAAKGVKAVIHGNTGKRPANRIPEKIRRQIIKLRRKLYKDFNDHHFTEKLVEVEKFKLSRPSVRRLLREAGVEATRKRRPRKHRQRRERKPMAGLMILWDGSPHAWLENRGPSLCMMGAVDDATSELLPGAHFVAQECAASYLRVLRDIVREKGVPQSAYMDKHGSLKRNDSHWTREEELRGEQDPTQVARALKALEIEIIYAHSPQAKGRVERGWGTHQDRLCSELRLAKASKLGESNRILEWYRLDHNRRFAIAPQDSTSAWRPLPRGMDLDRVCSFFYESTVGNDNTVRIGGVIIDIPPGPGDRGYARAKVEVRQLLDGSWRVYHKDVLIATAAATKSDDVRPLQRRKRSAASRVFRRGVTQSSVSLS
ncbi:MAG: ISNCY family transposase [Chloroflexota bacterium]